MTYQYQGPLHYWNHRSLVPREQYYYGYYGTYGPHTDLSLYKPVGSTSLPSMSHMENFSGGCSLCSTPFWKFVLCIFFAWFLLKLIGIL